jgi:hypothetical protein
VRLVTGALASLARLRGRDARYLRLRAVANDAAGDRD